MLSRVNDSDFFYSMDNNNRFLHNFFCCYISNTNCYEMIIITDRNNHIFSFRHNWYDFFFLLIQEFPMWFVKNGKQNEQNKLKSCYHDETANVVISFNLKERILRYHKAEFFFSLESKVCSYLKKFCWMRSKTKNEENEKKRE